MEIPVTDNIPWPLRDVWPELVEHSDRVAVLYAGRNSETVLALPNTELINIINEQLSNGKEIIVLDNSHESFIESEVSKIYKVLPSLNTTNDNIYYLTNSSDAVCIHDLLCERNNWTNPINVVVLNIFEYGVKSLDKVSHGDPYVVRNKDKKFLCMNRMPHLHRTCLLGLMLENNLVDNSYYSFYDTTVCVSEETTNNIRAKLSSGIADTIISNVQSYAISLPLRLTLDEFASNPNGLTPIDAAMFDNSYFSVVPETYFFKNSFLNELNTVFHTEKTYNAILMKHPFIIMGVTNSLDHLHHNGYRTFHPYIDESYDDVWDDEQRMTMIINEVKRLCSLTNEQLIEWQENIREIVEHNYQVMINRHAGPLNGISLRKNNQ